MSYATEPFLKYDFMLFYAIGIHILYREEGFWRNWDQAK